MAETPSRTPHPIAALVESFLAASGMTPSAFGKAAVGDPLFVFELRQGREPRRETCAKVKTYIRENAPKGFQPKGEAA